MAIELEQPVQEMKSALASTSDFEEISNSLCLDCSICLDSACEPVITLCGHLFCWPCIYKWLEFQRSTLSTNESAQCPVCKSGISDKSMVPLYGRGQTQPKSSDKTGLKLIIPPRPTSYVQSQQTFSNHEEPSSSFVAPDLSSPMSRGSPMCGYGEMVYERMFGNSERLYTYPYSYYTEGNISPGQRRLEIQTSRSLNRISFFLFCCIMLCLFLF